MSFCICRVEKYNKSNIKAVGNHHSREKDSYSSNPDIDPLRTPKNMNYGPIAALKTAVWEQINKRAPMPEGKTRRKDAVLCFEVLVSASPEFWPENWQEMSQQQFKQTQGFAYFSDAFKFLKGKFGDDNYIGASIHLDEKTPHMSMVFVPIVGDKLCAKEILTRRVLRDLQTEIAEKVGKQYGLERGQENSGRKHLSTPEFKMQQELCKLQERFNASVADLNKMISDVETEKAHHDEALKGLQEKIAKISELDEEQYRKLAEYVDVLLDEQTPEFVPGR